MSDSDVFNHDDEVPEFKIRIACECYSDPDYVRDAVARLPDFGKLEWGSPCTPDPFKLIDAELVLIVSDKESLLMAIGRSALYKYAGRAHVLIYLQDEVDVPAEAIPGLVLPRSELRLGLFKLTLTLLEPVLWPGLVGVDWTDARNISAMGGQVVMVKTSSSRPRRAIEVAVTQLRERAAGRAIQGLQAAFFCSKGKLATRYIGDLSWACKDGLPLPDKDSDGYDAYFIVAAPILDWPEDDWYEVRLFARVECAGEWPSDLLLSFSDGPDG